MANVKISALPALSSPDSVDVLPIVDDSATTTKKVSVADLGAKILENVYAGDILFFGDQSTDGSYRLGLIGGVLKFQKRVSGSWVDKDTIN